MNLHHLRIFLAVAETGSFSKAAEILKISQPAVSVQVKKLEDELELALFEQIGKTVHLTPAALYLRDQARNLFRQAEDIEEHLAHFRGITAGNLRLGASTTPGTYLLPYHLPAFQLNFPKVNLTLQLGNTRQIQEDLADNKIDLAIVGEEHLPLPELVTEPVTTDRLLLVGSANHPLAGRSKLKWTEIIHFPFVFRESGSNTRQIFEKWLQCCGLPVPSGTELGSTEAIKRMIAGSGQSLGVISSLAVSWEIEAGLLAEIKVEGFELARTFRLAQHKDKKLTPLLAEFKRFLRASLSEKPPTP